MIFPYLENIQVVHTLCSYLRTKYFKWYMYVCVYWNHRFYWISYMKWFQRECLELGGIVEYKQGHRKPITLGFDEWLISSVRHLHNLQYICIFYIVFVIYEKSITLFIALEVNNLWPKLTYCIFVKSFTY